MARVHTHYDNLKVAQNAPIEVIRAAYKTLSQRYHPDRNPGDTEAARIMTIINASYDVLCAPQKRFAHDVWIAQQEQTEATADADAARHRVAQTTSQHTSPPEPVAPARATGVPSHIWKYRFWYLLAGFIFWASIADKSPPPPGPKPYQATPPAPPSAPAWVRPDTAPNGSPWPATASYVKGYQRLHTDGLSSVTVDNSRNDSDVFVKLVSLDGPRAFPVRNFFIPAYDTFTVNKVRSGSYDVRYRDLSTGGLSRSEAFELEETPMRGGTQYSRLTMTLYTVQHGNMQTYRLSEAEF
jgi:DnaJ domain